MNIFQFLTKDELKKTRVLCVGFQSDLVKHHTKFVDMSEAILEENLDNMKWILDRYNGSNAWQDNIKMITFFPRVETIANLGIMKWLYENGMLLNKKTLAFSVGMCGLETLKWLNKIGCHWGRSTFDNAIPHYDLEFLNG